MTDYPQVKIYTDGACVPNPGPGGYAAVLLYGGRRRELIGGRRYTTNNRMELLAAIVGLNVLTRPCRVTVLSDSQYVVEAVMKGWAVRWRANGWKRNGKEYAVNPDLWGRLLNACAEHEVTFGLKMTATRATPRTNTATPLRSRPRAATTYRPTTGTKGGRLRRRCSSDGGTRIAASAHGVRRMAAGRPSRGATDDPTTTCAAVALAFLASSGTPTTTAAPEKKEHHLTFEVYKDAKGEYRWRLKAANGEIIATPGEGYKAKADCLHGIDLIKEWAAKAKVEDDTK